ncbi:MAG: amino acid adenylation domain-containing protein [Candidatus Aminicenantes bacterium]|nr:amino acid adenylation domain-containing protein [Candidatus Aminicenantes bacterium]NIM78327.1 amino acid adenylation domain-containing protein [Candidatus Aminicenantes bacterium]NIN17558.1 amino acid adenylation domain-containing protein [Candidatus Aminicenantes bacterium]NIN41444.1 amino acid adenylation domain-containing protein [Candidatus Aminicenantes bacterium]NIN84210.1 amino acid adenylation domain-containing protein [Candidatus Aminicenantes bacterium]
MRNNNYPDNLKFVANQKIKEKNYWLEKLSGDWEKNTFPYSHKKAKKQGCPGDFHSVEFGFPQELFSKLMKLSGGKDVKLYMVLAAGLVVLINKYNIYTGKNNIIVGSPIYKQDIDGKFVNTVLVLRNQLQDDMTFKELLLQVRQTIIEAAENCNYPVEVLAEQLGKPYSQDDDFPLFDIVILLENIHDKTYIQHINCNIKFLFQRVGECVRGILEYSVLLYDRWIIERIINHFMAVFQHVLFDLDIKISAIDILSEDEKKLILEDFNITSTAYPGDKTIFELFEEQVERRPEKIALVGSWQGVALVHPADKGAVGKEEGSGDPVQLTYRKLNEKSNQVANYLHYEIGVEPDQRVGMLMDRSISMIIIMLGILKAGGAYVPISPSFPEDRIKTMIDDADIRILISQKRCIRTLNRLQWECKNLDTFLCIDSENVHEEEEVEQSELMDGKLWDYVGETSVDEITGGGWNSSYTGVPISREEMEEYGDNILEKLTPLLHKNMRVMEIGVASGISMYRIAPRVGLYVGTDLSGVIIRKNKEQIKKQGCRNIKLRTLAAHEIHRLEEKDFDLVILNSVIQCFHGHNYLRKVIRKVIHLMGDSGYIFIGDIMDRELKEDLIASLVAFKLAHRKKDYRTKIDWSEELFVSRSFLEDLAWDYPEIRGMEFSGKIYTIENELTKFRYDALIYINKIKARGESKDRKGRHKHQHDARVLRKYGKERLSIEMTSGNLAYIIYTSGSTGKPKGTLTMHYNVARLVKNTNYLELHPGDRVLQLSDYAFDGSVFDIFAALLNGSTLVMVNRGDLLEIGNLCSLIKREGISVFLVVTSLFNTIMDVGLESLSGVRKVLFGGERVSVSHAVKALEYLGKGRILHMYGPTETTVYAAYYPVDEIDKNQFTVPIGAPIANTWIYILGKHLNLVPIMVTGKIYIGGDGVARGYLNKPELTAEKFILVHSSWLIADRREKKARSSGEFPMSYELSAMSCLYKTGDLGRWLADDHANMEFIGRIDHQVKVRGYRIELGEIERCLLSYPSIKECTVIAREDEKENHYLCAYLVDLSEERTEVSELKDYLSQSLPDFMIPSYFVQVDKLPLGSTGKIDRLKLPDPRLLFDESSSAPRDKVDEKMVEIWWEILGIGKELIGINSNFFDLGGHSLKASLLTAKIHKEFDVKVGLAEVFIHQTLRELCDYIRNASPPAARYLPIEKAEEKEYYVLSAAQKRLYIIQQMELESTRYNMPYRFPFEGAIDKERLENTFKRLIERHESFRTSFHMIDDQPVQKIHAADEVAFEIEFYDLTTGGMADRPFDLSAAPLLRVGLIHTPGFGHPSQEGIPGDKHILLVEMHHIISDGTSQEILAREFAALYAGEELLPLRLQYRDYAGWQNSNAQQAIMKEQEKYWLREFSDQLPILNLSTDYPRPLMQSFEGRRLCFFLSKEITEALKKRCKETNATLYMILLSVFNILLTKLSGQVDIIVGTPIAGRRHADLQDIIGMFVNTLSMRNYLQGDKAFMEFLKEVKDRTLEVYDNQEYQFEDLVEKVSVRRDTRRNPIFDVMFNFLNQADYQGNVEKVNLDEVTDEGEIKALFDLMFQGAEIEKVIYITVDYCTKLYREETIRRFIGYFKKILVEVQDDPYKKLSSIEIISGEEKKQMLFDFNDTASEFTGDKTLHELFADQAARTPEKIALVGSWQGVALVHPANKGEITGETGQLTYGELNKRSNQVARLLYEKGVEPDTAVGIMVERSIEMIVGILAILKAGAAYLPIDPDYPEERIRYMLEDSNAKVLVSEVSKVSEVSGGTVVVTHPTHLCYVIYTSGTTGKPKGVMLEHRNLVNLIRYQFNYTVIDFTRVLQFTTISFDVSAQEIFSTLLAGGTLFLVSKETIRDISQLLKVVEKEKIKTVFWPASFLKFVMNEEDYVRLMPASLEHIVTAGEQVIVNQRFRKYLESSRVYLHNHYGPSETHVVTAWTWEVGQREELPELPPIGRPISNTSIYILDNGKNLVPVGAAGELVIGGIQVGRGYLNRPELTAISYKSYRTYISKKIYKTGDLARWLADGNIEFLGRIDQQIKIRGFRVELGEIESQLLNHRNIKDAVVLAREDKKIDKYLCAYVVLDEEPEPSELRAFLSKHLPDYMIPAYFVRMDSLPLTPNRKVDRRALPKPQLGTGMDYTAPRNNIERKLAKVWSEVLGIEREVIGIDSNFFELGGHSLKATILTAKVHKEFQVKLPLVQVFKTPYLRGLSQYIEELVEDKYTYMYTAIKPVEEKEYYRLSSSQKRLFFLHRMEPHSTAYNMPEVIPLTWELSCERLEQTFKQLIARHESLRTSFEMKEGKPVQRVHDEAEFEIECYDLATISDFIRPFDLSQAPLIRVGVIEIKDNYHLLLADMHHIISDGLSHGILVRDFMDLYHGNKLLPLRFQYKDYTEWQNTRLQTDELKQQEKYWLNIFAGDIPVLNLPTDYPRPRIQRFEGDFLSFEIDEERTVLLRQVASREEATLYIVLLTVYAIFLSKITGQEDIVIGTPIASRMHADLDHIIGMFANTLALRNFPGGQKSFSCFLREVKGRTLNAFENQEYPFEELVEKLAVVRDTGRNPLFDVMFALQSVEMGYAVGADATVGANPVERSDAYADAETNQWQPDFKHRISKFDITLHCIHEGETLQFAFEFCTKLFKRETIKRFKFYFGKIISLVLQAPEIRLWQIEIISEKEKQKILYEFNDTRADYPLDKTIHELFEEQAAKTPDSAAVVGHGCMDAWMHGNISITFRELNEKSNQLAHFLREEGVGSDTIVGLMMERSIEMIIGILGILKAGGAYLPIDPDYPPARQKYMLADSKAKVLLKKSEIAQRPISKFETNPNDRNSNDRNITNGPIVLNFEHLDFEFVSDFGFRASNLNSSNLVYLIYTSGTTGKPKGVMLEHRSLANLIHYQFNYTDIDFSRVLQFTTIGFDVSAQEIFSTLLAGGILFLVSKETIRDISQLLKVVEKEKIKTVFWPASFLKFVMNEEDYIRLMSASLEHIVTAGEQLIINERFKRYLQGSGVYLHNHYGPSETHVVTAWTWGPGQGEELSELPPIGKPISNTNIYILDRGKNLVPIGVPGELSIGGIQVGRGYLNRPELTAEKFILAHSSWLIADRREKKDGSSGELPMSYELSAMSYLFKTGDLARWLPDGNIEFLGRIDQQVKIRGFRVELGEIESQLLNHDFIKEAVVLARQDDRGLQYLCAYIAAGAEKKISSSGLREYLANDLPDYMIPAYFVQMEKIPLTANGKVDRRMLPRPREADIRLDSTYAAPETGLQRTIAEIWKEVLGRDKVGTRDNFFDLGGNSLDVITVSNKLKETLKKEITVVTLFTYPTIGSLENYLKSNSDKSSEVFESRELERSELIDEGKDLMQQTLKKLDKED